MKKSKPKLGYHNGLTSIMKQDYDETYEIDYSEFCSLINEGKWNLKKGIKNNWDGERRKQYIDGLMTHKTCHRILFIADNCIHSKINVIDVYISAIANDEEYPSTDKHIQFVKNL